jgi:hypothetical protein
VLTESMVGGFIYQFKCSGASTIFNSLEEVWAAGTEFSYCETIRVSGVAPSEAQKSIFTYDFDNAAYDKLLKDYYKYCTSSTLGSTDPAALSKSEYANRLIAVKLCPNNPGAAPYAQIVAGEEQAERDAASAAADDARLRAEGRRVGDGTYRVGEPVLPGTYVSEGSISNCYWELLDSAGNIIDNNFVSSALRLEVVVVSDAYSFSSNGCGTWDLQE